MIVVGIVILSLARNVFVVAYWSFGVNGFLLSDGFINLSNDSRIMRSLNCRELSGREPGWINVRKRNGIGTFFVFVGAVIVLLGCKEFDPCRIVFFKAVDG